MGRSSMGDIVGYDRMGVMGSRRRFMGADDIVGATYSGDADLDHLLAMGADSPQAPLNLPNQGHSYEVRDVSRGVWREHYLPLNLVGGPTATVAGAATVTVQAQPQKKFRVNRLIISSDVAGGFVVNDIRVGVLPQLASVGSLPGRMFTETAVGIGLHGDTADISQIIFVVIQNITGGALPFVGAMQGIVVE